MAYGSDQSIRDWQSRPFTAPVTERLGWLNEQIGEGETWVQSQPAYKDIAKGIDIIQGRSDEMNSMPAYRSSINTSRLKRDIREIIATLANIRPFWGYTSDNPAYRPIAAMMNKVARAVYLESFFDRKLKGALQYMSITGTGYIWPKYHRTMYGHGPGRIDFDYLGALDVLPVQLPRDNNLQEAYVVTIVDFIPVAKAHGMFPLFQDKLYPVAKRRYRGTVANRRVSLAERFKFGERRDSFAELYCEVRYTYVLDLAINTTGMTLPMGQPNTSWYYEVPSLGTPIRQRDPLTGNVYERKARPEDCRIYPRRRLQISTKDCLMYDGPAWDWHSMVPLLKYSADIWAWEGLGYSLAKDGYEYQVGINQLERAAQTVANARLRPGMTYDIGAGGEVNDMTAEGLDPFKPDIRVGIDSTGGSEKPPFATILPEHLLEVPQWFFALMDHYNQGMDYQLGLKDITALAKLRANANSDSMEKILDVMGPVVQDISRDMEAPMRDAGEIVKFLILQYMTTSRVMQYVGVDGVSPELFDYDPETLIPSHMPFEAARFKSGQPSDITKMERALHFAQNVRFMVTPYSIHEIQQMEKKLAYLQLKKAGVWISSQTVAEAFNVPNYGTIEGNTEIEKYWSEKELEMEHAARLAQVAEGLGAGMPQPGKSNGQAGPGRPSTDAQPPRLKQKGIQSGGRSVISTSG